MESPLESRAEYYQQLRCDARILVVVTGTYGYRRGRKAGTLRA
jgi:hypothetical protein